MSTIWTMYAAYTQKLVTVSMFLEIMEHVTLCIGVGHLCSYSSVQQWAQTEKLYKLPRRAFIRINLLLFWVFLWDLLTLTTEKETILQQYRTYKLWRMWTFNAHYTSCTCQMLTFIIQKSYIYL